MKSDIKKCILYFKYFILYTSMYFTMFAFALALLCFLITVSNEP